MGFATLNCIRLLMLFHMCISALRFSLWRIPPVSMVRFRFHFGPLFPGTHLELTSTRSLEIDVRERQYKYIYISYTPSPWIHPHPSSLLHTPIPLSLDSRPPLLSHSIFLASPHRLYFGTFTSLLLPHLFFFPPLLFNSRSSHAQSPPHLHPCLHHFYSSTYSFAWSTSPPQLLSPILHSLSFFTS